jgi:hypothetical protein
MPIPKNRTMDGKNEEYEGRTIDDFDATDARPASLEPMMSAPAPMPIPKKQKPSWYRQHEQRKTKDMQESLQDYFGNDAFRLGKGESIETVVEGTDVAILWDTERNKIVGFPRPALETSYRRRVVHDVLTAEYSEDSSEDSSEES